MGDLCCDRHNPEGLQLWTIHTRAGTTLRECGPWAIHSRAEENEEDKAVGENQSGAWVSR